MPDNHDNYQDTKCTTLKIVPYIISFILWLPSLAQQDSL